MNEEHFFESETMSNSCKHGQLARSCELCHNEEDLLKLEKINNDLLEALKSCSPPHPACGETFGDCFKAGNCGCSLGAAIAKAEGTE
jgi:hypothetical protein